MKRNTCIWGTVFSTLFLLPRAHSAGKDTSAVVRQQAVQAYGHLPLSFEANQGQTDRRVKFFSHGSGYSLFLTGDEAVLTLGKKSGVRRQKVVAARASEGVPQAAAFPSLFRSNSAELNANSATLNPERQARAVLRMRLVGANATAKVMGLEELPGKSNYFIGNDPNKWRANVPNYAKVKYKNVYPGVDLVYYGNLGQLEYDFVVQPRADPNSIQLAINSGEQVGSWQEAAGGPLRVDANGDLVVETEGGEVIFHKPVVYQPPTDNGQGTKDEGQRTEDKHFVDGKYVLKGESVAFEVARYDKTRPLVIDPTLAYSTYLGGSDFDNGAGIAVDASGNAYVTGLTASSNFPTTPGAFQTIFGGGADAFVSKLNAAGTALIYSTYLGGSSFDQGTGIAVDASGNAYVTGTTGSSNFPITPGAFQTIFGANGVAFISKLNATGSALVYSTYLGGSAGDNGTGIAVDASGNAYVAGFTQSSDFPTTPGAFQTTLPALGVSSFVSKLNAAGSALVYSTYLGETSSNLGIVVAVDASGDAYVTGGAAGSSFPTTPGAFQTIFGGGADAFVSKLNATGSALIYSTFLGGSGYDQGFGIAVDASGNAYVTGVAISTNFPTTSGAFQTTLAGSTNAFVSKLNATGSTLLYSTYLGGSNFDYGQSIAVDSSGNAYVAGRTGSSNFPTTASAIQTTFGGGDEDAFVSKLNSAGSALLYSSYLGGSSDEEGLAIAVDPSGNAYVAGLTVSSDFPTTPGAFQTIFGGLEDAFVSKLSFGIPFSSFSGKLEVTVGTGSFELNTSFTLGPGGSINPPTQPVSLKIGTYSLIIPAGSFIAHKPGYAFEGVINGVSLEVLIKFGSTAGSYHFLAEGRGANLKGTTNPVTVTISIGNNTGSTQVNAEFQ